MEIKKNRAQRRADAKGTNVIRTMKIHFVPGKKKKV